MKIGYVRVSTKEQITDRQFVRLIDICDKIYSEKKSAKTTRNRPIYNQVIKALKRGDTLVIMSIDRAFRNTLEAIHEAEKLRQRGINFQIINLAIDTSNADGMLAYTVVAAVAQHERERNSERVKQGLKIARKAGKRLGRPPKMTDRQIKNATKKLKLKDSSLEKVATYYGVHPWTLTRNIRRLETEEP